MTEENKPIQEQQSASMPTPWQRIEEQIKFLDRALTTIDGWSDESNHTRGFIVGQIEALRWAAKLWDTP